MAIQGSQAKKKRLHGIWFHLYGAIEKAALKEKKNKWLLGTGMKKEICMQRAGRRK